MFPVFVQPDSPSVPGVFVLILHDPSINGISGATGQHRQDVDVSGVEANTKFTILGCSTFPWPSWSYGIQQTNIEFAHVTCQHIIRTGDFTITKYNTSKIEVLLPLVSVACDEQ